MINFGILGCGRVAEWAFMPGMRKSHGAKVVAVASRSIGKARGFAGRHSIPAAYGSYGGLLDDPDVDAVYIALPNHLHAEWAMKAAGRKKHVLCEKPAAMNARECRQMAQACRRNRVILMEAFMYRLHPANLNAVKMIDSGKIGRVRFIRCALSFHFAPDAKEYRWHRNTGGGAFFDTGCYFVNLSRYITHREPGKILAVQEVHPRLKVDVSIAAILCFPGNVFSVCNSSFGTASEDFYEVIGDMGKLRVEKAFVTHTAPVVMTITSGGKTRRIKFPVSNPYACEIDHFVKCMKNGRLLPPAEDGVLNMRAMDLLSGSV